MNNVRNESDPAPFNEWAQYNLAAASKTSPNNGLIQLTETEQRTCWRIFSPKSFYNSFLSFSFTSPFLAGTESSKAGRYVGQHGGR